MSAVARLEAAALAARTPLHGSVELTWRCNFECIHCYQGGLRKTHRELSTAQWKKLLDEMADAGCLYLTITGGDPLLRADFAELYAHAHAKGFLINVFTNGALVTAAHAELFARLPPRCIEITLYGMSEETYARVAQRKGFDKVMAAIDLLVEKKLPVVLKSVALRPIAGEIPAMRAFAKAKGLGFRFDASIAPRLNGDRSSQAEMLSPQEQVELELEQSGAPRLLQTCTGGVPASDELLRCGATKVAFNVDPSGGVSGCVLLRQPMASSVAGFANAWDALAPFSKSLASKESGSCGGCGNRSVCGRCPATSLLEGGALEKPIPHHCELTQLRIEQATAAGGAR